MKTTKTTQNSFFDVSAYKQIQTQKSVPVEERRTFWKDPKAGTTELLTYKELEESLTVTIGQRQIKQDDWFIRKVWNDCALTPEQIVSKAEIPFYETTEKNTPPQEPSEVWKRLTGRRKKYIPTREI